MNCIKDTREIPESITQQETIIYFYMLSKCESVEDEIHTLVSSDSLKRMFALDEEQIEEVLDSLYNAGVIAQDDDENIIVGYLSDKKVVLYTADDLETTKTVNPIEPLLERATKFKNGARRPLTRSLANNIIEALTTLTKNKTTEYTIHNMFTLFKACAELELQEEYRPFDRAEAGSLKRLLTNLGSKKLVDMITTYCSHFERWGNFPNILNMVKNKDAIYGKIIKTEKLKSDDDEDFA